MTGSSGDAIRSVLDLVDRPGAVPDPVELAERLATVDWSQSIAVADVVRLRSMLMAVEERHGVGLAHQTASAGLLSAMPGWVLTHDRGHRGRLLVFAMSPDGRYLAVGSDIDINDYDNEHCGRDAFGVLQVWEMASGRCVNTLPRVDGGVSFAGDDGERGRMRWHPSGTRVGAVFATNGIGVFDPFGESSEPTLAFFLTYTDHGLGWCWSPDGRQLAVGIWPGAAETDGDTKLDSRIPIVLIDVSVGAVDEAGEPRVLDPDQPTTHQGELAAHQGEPDRAASNPPGVLDWSIDQARITGFFAMGYTNGEAQVVTVDPAAVHVVHDVPAAAAAGASFSPDGRLLATLPDNGVAVWEIGADGGSVERFRYRLDEGETAFDAVWDPTGNRLAVLTDRGVLVFTLPAGDLSCRLVTVPTRLGRDHWSFGDGCAVAFAPNGERIAVLAAAAEGTTPTVTVWELASPRLACTAAAHSGIRGIAFGDGGQSLVGWGKGSLQFWDATTGRERCRYLQQTDSSEDDLVFHSDAGHPLAHPGGWLGDVFPRDPAFAVPDDGAFAGPGNARWHWLTAFPSGLVVCPPPARFALWRSLSFVLDRRIAWPAQWADGTSLLEVHDDWSTALRSARLPEAVTAEFRQWRSENAVDVLADRAYGIEVVPASTVRWSRQRQPLPATVEAPVRAPGYYRPRRVRTGDDGLTEAWLRSLIGTLVLVRFVDEETELATVVDVYDQHGSVWVELTRLERHGDGAWHGGSSTRTFSKIAWVAEVDYLGHPQDRTAAVTS